MMLPRWAAIRTESELPKLVLGTMNFGKRTPEPEARRIIELALERGIELLDTANVYNDGESERIVGRALRQLKSGTRQPAIATKVGLMRPGGKPEGLSQGRVLAAAEESLGRLGVESIDLYYLHAPDHATPIEQTLDALAQLLEQKKILAYGLSNFAAWQVLEIMRLADRRGMPRPIVSQVIYNLLIRQLEMEYLRFSRVHPIHNTIYNPLAGGLLSGRYGPGASIGASTTGTRFEKNAVYQRRYFSERMLNLAAEYGRLGAELALTPVELAYAWLCLRPGVDSILIGPATIEHLEAALAACDRSKTERLVPAALERIDRIQREFLGTDASYAR
jgi:aryl-alcohol dehydrogenase-like predicted oxidoreductase